MPAALFVHTELAARGGAEAVAAWMLEALKRRYEVSVLTWSRPDLASVNATYGTSLASDDVRWLLPGPIARRAVALIPDATGSWQKKSWLMRMSKRVHAAYDVLVACTSEFDFGRPGIQFVHHPWMAPAYAALKPYGRVDGWRLLPALARRTYRPWMALAEFSFAAMLENLTLANSEWTAAEYRRAYAREADTLYPPVAGVFRERAWSDRRDTFVMVARLEPDKNHHRVIDILRRVRLTHAEIRLRIVGTRLHTPAGEAYAHGVRSLLQSQGDWVTLDEDLSRDELMRVLSECRYGIHVRENEHFGIAVAEMARAGLIPFVHDSGGQVEIVEHPALRFRTDDEAVARIDAVLRGASLREAALARLRQSALRFTPERFADDLLRRVETWRTRAAGGRP